MTLPDLKGTATLDNAPFRKSVSEMQGDLRALQTIAKSAGTIRITADLSAAQRDIQRGARAVRDAVQEAIPTDMQRRINGLFGSFNTGAASAKVSASVFAAQASALRERINELDRAVKITRADFQSGFGEATPEEIGKLTSEMARLQRELKDVGDQAVASFGKYSAEAQKVANANRLAQSTAAAARGEISRLGLASQVKLGTSAALQQYGPQAGLAANGLFQFAAASDRARIAQGLFQKTIQKTGQTTDEAAQVLARLQDNLGVSAEVATDGVRALLRQGYTLAQAYKALEGAGASALAAGKSAGAGMQAYTDAVIAGDSARLTEAGISENLSTFYQREAKARNTTVDGLTRQQKVQAELNLVTAATADEVGDLSALMGGLGGNTSSANRELTEASRALGEKLIPLATNGARALTRILEIFTSLPEPVQTTVALLGASAVAVGVLAGPVSALARGYSQIRDGLKGIQGASSALNTAATATAAAGDSALDTAGNLASTADTFGSLGERAKNFYGVMSTKLSAYITSTLLATGATNVFQASVLKVVATDLFAFFSAGAVGAATLATGVGAAAAALGVFAVNSIKATQAIYDQIDTDNNTAFELTMARAAELRKTGTELGRAQARVLYLRQMISDAQQGEFKGTDGFGGRIYGPPDEARLKALQADLAGVQQSVVQLYTEAQRRGQLNLKLTDDQKKAVKDLQQTLAGRSFDLKVTGMTELGAELARLDQTMDDLRTKFKQPFIVEGKLMDPRQTPALRTGLAQLDAQALAEQAAIRKKFADQAAEAAKQSALDVQAAEVAALRDGAKKRAAERQLEVDAVERAAKEQAEKYKDFPKQQEKIEEAGRKVIAAKRRGWAEEDLALAEQTAQRVADAERTAQASVVAAMEEGRAKREASRALDLENLKRNIEQRVKELAGDPEAQAKVQASGQEELESKIAEQGRQRVQEEKDVAAQVAEIRRAARDAETAAIADEDQRRATQRESEIADIEDANRKRIEGLKGYPQAQADALAAGQRQVEALRRGYAREDEQRAKETAGRIADAWLKAQDAELAAQKAGRENRAAQFELDLSRRLAGAKNNAIQTAQIEAAAIGERARLAETAVRAQYTADAKRLEINRIRALDNDKLSNRERQDIWRAYYSDLNTLSGNFQASEKVRLQKQEEDTRAATEKIRLARVAAAVRPAENAGRDVSALQAQQQLAQSAAARLALEVQVQAAQERQGAAYAATLARAKELNLTDEERTALGEKLVGSNNAVTQSQLTQLDLQKQIRGEAEQVVSLYGRLTVLTGRESGGAAAQRELAEATTQVGDAYARALPYLDAYRAGSLRPQDYALAGEALGGLVTALEAQRQKLEALRSEYDRQRDSLKSVQDVLKGFGEELGDQSLLNNAISFNQTTYDQAKVALDALLKGGQYDAAQLAEATGKLQSSYSGLKDAVAALGEARAREFEKESGRIKDEGERRTRLLDAQIKAAKAAGLDTSGLESQRDAIVTEAERQVRSLEAKATAARKAAQDALSDRTRGLQTLLQGVQQGAASAQKGVAALGREVQQAEKDVQDSAGRMRRSLEGTFSGLPILAGKAGKTAGQQFAEQFLAGVKSLKLPTLSATAATTAATRPAVGSITQIITINGQNVTGTVSPTFKAQLKGLAAEAEAECRRRGK